MLDKQKKGYYMDITGRVMLSLRLLALSILTTATERKATCLHSKT